MLEIIPTNQDLQILMGADSYSAWEAVCCLVESLYEMETLWNTGGKRWTYEYKYRRGGKTLCALYARENCFGLLIVLGKREREAVENALVAWSPAIREIYDSAKTYHDGKWMMLELSDLSLLEDVKRLLHIKRRPNKK